MPHTFQQGNQNYTIVYDTLTQADIDLLLTKLLDSDTIHITYPIAQGANRNSGSLTKALFIIEVVNYLMLTNINITIQRQSTFL